MRNSACPTPPPVQCTTHGEPQMYSYTIVFPAYVVCDELYGYLRYQGCLTLELRVLSEIGANFIQSIFDGVVILWNKFVNRCWFRQMQIKICAEIFLHRVMVDFTEITSSTYFLKHRPVFESWVHTRWNDGLTSEYQQRHLRPNHLQGEKKKTLWGLQQPPWIDKG